VETGIDEELVRLRAENGELRTALGEAPPIPKCQIQQALNRLGARDPIGIAALVYRMGLYDDTVGRIDLISAINSESGIRKIDIGFILDTEDCNSTLTWPASVRNELDRLKLEELDRMQAFYIAQQLGWKRGK
jgi:hypothetical protein